MNKGIVKYLKNALDRMQNLPDQSPCFSVRRAFNQMGHFYLSWQGEIS